MVDINFRAFVVRERDNGTFVRAVETRSVDDLPEGEVLVKVHYSSLNYKDALSATGNRGVTRHFPHTPGIDAAGVVAHSTSLRFARGDDVIVIGYDLGMDTDGGYGQYIRVPADWVVKRPSGLTLRESMIYGTAGFTAAMAVYKMMAAGVEPGQGEVLVTGATGGVGSLAVAILAREGFDVVAATGKTDAADYLYDLGASAVVAREDVTDPSRPMLKGRWAGVVDSVGGDMLATALAASMYGGVVTCAGLVASPKLNTTVYPFILRGVSLLGIDSSQCSLPFRREIWAKLADDWKLSILDEIAREVTLDELDPEIDRILHGAQRGRVLVRVGE